jgi:hypothetical protein
MVQLSGEQQTALRDHGAPLEVQDPAGHEIYYLISAEQYGKLRRVLEQSEPIDPSYFEFTDFTPTTSRSGKRS